ncbi:MAG: SWIM zinc finger family protein [Candidatus Competibacteraceae bacterium]|nr:SWIM zinc finger family protein [Candidatus Competibacteraceae bacterium]
MPEDIEQVFADEGLSLFPRTHGDLATECSCPDYSNPCKHIAAVYYLLGEAFDNDPFLMFRLRGMERDALLAHLSETAGAEGDEDAAAEPEPLPEQPSAFWTMSPLPENATGALAAPRNPPPCCGVSARFRSAGGVAAGKSGASLRGDGRLRAWSAGKTGVCFEPVIARPWRIYGQHSSVFSAVRRWRRRGHSADSAA